MNIFYLDQDPKSCAQQHVDKHVVKMILEYCQLLSTAHRVIDGVQTTATSKSGRSKKVFQLPDSRDSVLYSATHVNHPSAVWVRQSSQNYLWLTSLLRELCTEYTARYGKVHKCESSGLVDVLRTNVPRGISSAGFTEPTPAMPDDFKVEGDSVMSYRNYYNGSKTRMFSWKNRNTPEWVMMV